MIIEVIRKNFVTISVTKLVTYHLIYAAPVVIIIRAIRNIVAAIETIVAVVIATIDTAVVIAAIVKVVENLIATDRHANSRTAVS